MINDQIENVDLYDIQNWPKPNFKDNRFLKPYTENVNPNLYNNKNTTSNFHNNGETKP